MIREILESWYAEYPDEGKDDLGRRFRAPTLNTYSGAFFELYCHALLRASGYVVELHPETDSGRCPDFKVCDDNGPLFYLEATVVLPPIECQGTASRDAQVNECINSMYLPNLFLKKKIRKYGDKQLSCKKLKQFLKEAAIDFEREDARGYGNKLWEYRCDDWEIDFGFISCSISDENPERHRPLGVISGPVVYPQPEVGLLKSLKKKAEKYGVLDLPFLVAVNCLHEDTDDEDVGVALVGGDPCLWHGPAGPQNKRISGVIVANHMKPWTIGSHQSQLWLNPFANHKLPVEAMPLPRYSWNELGELIRYQHAQAAPDLLQTRRVSQAIAEERSS